MDPEESYDQFLLDMRRALQDAQERKWLSKERHGYCFYCERETLVYEVIAKESPSQPPKCEDCFIDGAISFLESPEAKRLIKEFQENGFEEFE